MKSFKTELYRVSFETTKENRRVVKLDKLGGNLSDSCECHYLATLGSALFERVHQFSPSEASKVMGKAALWLHGWNG